VLTLGRDALAGRQRRGSALKWPLNLFLARDCAAAGGLSAAGGPLPIARCDMSMPRWIAATLDEEHVPYQVRHHRPCFTAQEVAAAEHVSGHRLAKVVVVKADEELVVVVLPASERLDLDAVRRTLNCSQCRMATEREIAERFPDC
jgi:Aminoacyl-tRNA editing domain